MDLSKPPFPHLACATNPLILARNPSPEVDRSEAKAAMPFRPYFLLTRVLVSCLVFYEQLSARLSAGFNFASYATIYPGFGSDHLHYFGGYRGSESISAR